MMTSNGYNGSHATSSRAVFATDGRLVAADRNFPILFGFSPEEIIGKYTQDILLDPPYRTLFTHILNNFLDEGNERHCLIEGKHQNNTTFPLLMECENPQTEATVTVKLTKVEYPTCSFTFDPNGCIIASVGSEIFGYSASDACKLKLSELLPYLVQKQLDGEQRPSYKYLKQNFQEHKIQIVTGLSKAGSLLLVSMEMDTLNVGELFIFRARMKKLDVDNMECILCLDGEGIIKESNGFILPLFGYNEDEVLEKAISSLAPEITCYSQENCSKRQKTSMSEWTSYSSTSDAHFKHRNGDLIPISWKALDIGSERRIIRMKRANVPLSNISASPLRVKRSKQIGSYLIQNTIGSGNYGKVKRAIHVHTHREVAVKILNKTTMQPVDLERSKRECEILQQLDHPNIVKLLEAHETERKLYLFLELVGGTDLKTHILQKNPEMQEKRLIFHQLVSAIAFCHQNSIIHRDLKQTNILVDGDNNNIKLIDFGLSNYTEEGKLRSTFCGSPAFAAPEMLTGTQYTGPEVDVWSLGVVLYLMITNKLPFESVGQLLSGRYTPPDISDSDLQDLVKIMLESDPQKRATIPQIMEHRWLIK